MRRNKESLIRVLLLGAMDILMLISLCQGEVNHYVHPRMNKYIMLCVVLIGIMILFEVPQLAKVRHRNHMKLYGIIATYMVTLFLVPRMSNQVTLEKESTASNSSSIPAATNAKNDNQEATIKANDKGEAYAESNNSDEGTQLDGSSFESTETKLSETSYTVPLYEDGYVVKDDEFGTWFLNVFEHMNDYEGKTVTLKAQVYYDESLQENEMVAVRGIMTCCIADLQYYGFVCRGEGVGDLPANSWVWVTGTLHVEDYLGTVEPTIIVSNISKAEPPEVEYSYFY